MYGCPGFVWDLNITFASKQQNIQIQVKTPAQQKKNERERRNGAYSDVKGITFYRSINALYLKRGNALSQYYFQIFFSKNADIS